MNGTFRNRAPLIGEMTTRVTYLRPKPTAVNSYNETDAEYEPAGNVWMKDFVEGGEEPTEATQNKSLLHHTLTTYFRKDVRPTWRLRIGERELNITGLNDIQGRHEFLEIQATEEVSLRVK